MHIGLIGGIGVAATIVGGRVVYRNAAANVALAAGTR